MYRASPLQKNIKKVYIVCFFDPEMAKRNCSSGPQHGIPGNDVADFLANRGTDGITSCDLLRLTLGLEMSMRY